MNRVLWKRAALRIALMLGSASAFPGPAAQELPQGGRTDWPLRDAEGRWVAYQADVRRNPARERAWLEFFAASREFGLLEWCALAGDRKFAGASLARLDAPQWIRVTFWAIPHADSHAREGGNEMLRTKDPALVLGWLRAHQDRTGVDGLMLAAELEGRGFVPRSAEGFLPPHDPGVLYAPLAPPDDVQAFGDRQRAETGVVYVHQVTRALAFFASSRRRPVAWLDRFHALFHHPHPEVRREALLAATKMAGYEPRWPSLLVQADDTAEAGEVREAAVLALSHSSHPGAWLALHRLAGEPDHPGFKAAVARLADLGDEFTIEHLDQVLRDRSDVRDDPVIRGLTARLRDRLGRQDPNVRAAGGWARPFLERAAWAELADDPLGATLVPWTLERLRRDAALPNVRTDLEGLARDYVPALPAPLSPGEAWEELSRAPGREVPKPLEGRLVTLRDRVRALASQALGR